VRISLILTVLNEAGSLPRLLDSIATQTRAPDEIIIVDGGSTDGTIDLLRAQVHRPPLKIISQPGVNISQGRNAAVRAATGDIICSTDAGVRLDTRWVEELVQPFEKDEGKRMKHEKADSSFILHPSSFDVVSGFFIPDPQTVFETALAATTLPALDDIHADTFLPSSRSVAFRKAVWDKVCGYPEWLDFCEDLIFDFALRDAGCRFTFAPRAVVHFRPRSTLRAFFKQYYLYARGDGKANLWSKRHVIRYLTYLVALPLLIALTMVALLASLPLWLLAATFMFFTPYKRLALMIRGKSFADKLRASAWVPVIRVTGDIAKMIGYPVGVVWRIRNRTRIAAGERG
jgi:glycosyltransferase involved in cell wall biosynthesis